MLTQKQNEEIIEHLEKAQNPLFYFDNDPDGLCSFLLLQRWLGRGKGVAGKSDLGKSYFRKVGELNADYIFILDKPLVDKEFFEEARKINIPVVWIDHHEIPKEDIPDFVHYFNPFFNTPSSNEPVTALCYDATKKKDDLWVAVTGCISDGFVPPFYSEFEKKYPDLTTIKKKAFDILYGSELGKIARILGLALKDRTTNVVNMLKFLMKVKTPYEVLEETSLNRAMHERFNEIEKKINHLVLGVEEDGENLLFFRYGGDLSISSEVANDLWYRFPKKFVIVAYVKGWKTNLSLRGKNVKEKFLQVLPKIKGLKGGGHDNAVGGQMNSEDLDKFREEFEKVL